MTCKYFPPMPKEQFTVGFRCHALCCLRFIFVYTQLRILLLVHKYTNYCRKLDPSLIHTLVKNLFAFVTRNRYYIFCLTLHCNVARANRKESGKFENVDKEQERSATAWKRSLIGSFENSACAMNEIQDKYCNNEENRRRYTSVSWSKRAGGLSSIPRQ